MSPWAPMPFSSSPTAGPGRSRRYHCGPVGRREPRSRADRAGEGMPRPRAREATRTLRWSWGGTSLAEVGLVPIPPRASHRLGSLTRRLPHTARCKSHPHDTRSSGRQGRPCLEEPRTCLGDPSPTPAKGTARTRLSRGMETPCASPATRARPRPGPSRGLGCERPPGPELPLQTTWGGSERGFPLPEPEAATSPDGDGGHHSEGRGCPGPPHAAPRPGARGSGALPRPPATMGPL